MHPIIPISLVFAGCCSNVVFLEYIIKDIPSSGNIITFSQFLFIALEGFIFATNFGRKKPVIPLTCLFMMTTMFLITIIFQNAMLYFRIPIPIQMTLRSNDVNEMEFVKTYFVMVSLFFVVQVTNNLAFAFNISMVLHMIFRAGSLIANLVLGVIILKRNYKLSKYVSVIMITIGICICTIVSADTKGAPDDTEEEVWYQFMRWIVGISLLTFALFMSARMGIYQEEVYVKYGKHPSEALFYNHALPLPGFLLVAGDIYQHALIFNKTEPVDVPMVGVDIPIMWLMLLGNVITQYVCIRAVFILTTECQSLTVTLVVTLRKFTSLLFSIWYFQNPFTLYHWIGTFLVFGGTLLFTETFEKIYRAIVPPKEKAQ